MKTKSGILSVVIFIISVVLVAFTTYFYNGKSASLKENIKTLEAEKSAVESNIKELNENIQKKEEKIKDMKDKLEGIKK